MRDQVLRMSVLGHYRFLSGTFFRSLGHYRILSGTFLDFVLDIILLRENYRNLKFLVFTGIIASISKPSISQTLDKEQASSTLGADVACQWHAILITPH